MLNPKPKRLQVADYTLRLLKRRVPPAVPGIMFLSGEARIRQPILICIELDDA